MNTNETIQYTSLGFDNDKYIQLQSNAILERIEKFPNGRLYLEIGGKLISDPHASRVLPGFKEDNKVKILKNLNIPFEILFCLNYEDILSNRQLSNHSQEYIKSSYKIIRDIQDIFGIKPKIVINRIKDKYNPILLDAIDLLKVNEFEVHKRYYIEGYPNETERVLSKDGYGKDEYIPVKTPLVIVTGSASNSGKMSTCLGQIYVENSIYNINSGYAKYETFPIWNLDLKHPINLAYEAATADIGDTNVLDTYHMNEYGIKSVNYNRDVDAFRIIKLLTKEFLKETNYVTKYKSPTDMGINTAGECILDDEIVCIASLEEIRRRRDWYQELVDQNVGKNTWVYTCEELERDALKYIKEHEYITN